MAPELRIVLAFQTREALRAACSFDKGRALLRAPWSGVPLLMGRAATIQIKLAQEPGARIVFEGARTGPGRDGTQWFFVYGKAAEGLASGPRGKPAPAVAARTEPPRGEMDKMVHATKKSRERATIDTFDAVREPRLRCKIDAFVDVGGGSAQPVVITDVSSSGVRLDGLAELPRAHTLVRVLVHGQGGILFRARVSRVDAEKKSVGLRFAARNSNETEEIAAWVAEVRASVLSQGMAAGYLSFSVEPDDTSSAA